MAGKFDSVTDWLYELSMESGQDEEIGSVDELGWYGSFIFGEDDLKVLKEEFDDETPYYGAILSEDSQGFKDSELFETKEAFDKVWGSIQMDYDEMYNENEEENPAGFTESKKSFNINSMIQEVAAGKNAKAVLEGCGKRSTKKPLAKKKVAKPTAGK